MYKANFVPVGKDQASHVELTREIVRRFNSFYGDIFPEPKEIHTEVPVLPGTDGRKMSKSYGNAIYLIDSPKEIREKTRQMITDPARIRKTDPGNPDICDVFQMHKYFSTPEAVASYNEGCRNATLGCVECKKHLAEAIIARYGDIAEKSRKLRENPGKVVDLLKQGSARASTVATATMLEVRRAIRMDWE
jgi:tryptophanyl-tRNA synthetase